MSQPPDEGRVSSVFDDEAQERMKAAYRRGVRRIRNILFLVAAMTALFELLAYRRILRLLSDTNVLIAVSIDTTIMSAYVALGIWAGKKPFTALMTGLLLYLTIQTAKLLLAPYFNLSAFLASAMVVALFLSGLRTARALQRMPKF